MKMLDRARDYPQFNYVGYCQFNLILYNTFMKFAESGNLELSTPNRRFSQFISVKFQCSL
jgi:hypothetical protein